MTRKKPSLSGLPKRHQEQPRAFGVSKGSVSDARPRVGMAMVMMMMVDEGSKDQEPKGKRKAMSENS